MTAQDFLCKARATQLHRTASVSLALNARLSLCTGRHFLSETAGRCSFYFLFKCRRVVVPSVYLENDG